MFHHKPRLHPVITILALAGMSCAAPSTLGQDFNGDGFADLAIGAPGEDFGPNTDAGAVTIIYGSGIGGLDPFFPLPSTQFSQSATGIEIDEPGDNFGAALAWGDFNNDGFDDLAIGVPGEDTGFADAGAVAVLVGTPVGLLYGGTYFFQPSLLGADPDEVGDRFGAALACGDFNADGFADLAMGAPGEDVGTFVDAGLIHINHGSPSGIFPGAPLIWPVWDQGTVTLDPTEAGDAFAGVLAAGDFDGDLVDDLAISCEFEDFGSQIDAGGVTMVPGVSGLGMVPVFPTAQWWHQNSPGVPDSRETNDRFGAALATGDFDHNLADDLAIGVPGESLGTSTSTGAVHVLHGNAPGTWLSAFTPVAAQLWHQNTVGVPSGNASGDNFGAALCVFWNDTVNGFKHLAIGVPGNDIGTTTDSGAVITIYSGGMSLGLSAVSGYSAPELWHQNVVGIPQFCANGDGFGSSITAGDYDNNMCQDLAIGVPLDDISFADTGCVNVIYGEPNSGIVLDAFLPIPAELYQQNTPGIPDSNQAGDSFGSSLDRR